MPAPSSGHNPRDQCNRRGTRKNINGLLRDHLHTCVVLSTCGNADDSKFDAGTGISREEDSQSGSRDGDFWVTHDGTCIGSRIQSSAASRRRKSQILDNWAAGEARKMITTIERQANEAELLALSSVHPVSTGASSSLRETSPSQSECSIEIPNLRAASLVQMWRELEAEAMMTVENRTSCGNSAGSSSRTNTVSIADNASLSEEQSVGLESCDSADERNESLVTLDDSFTDWETDRMAPSESRVSDACKSETSRVSDMVRRLNSGNQTTSSLTSYSDEIDREQSTMREPSPREQSLFDRGGNSGFLSNGNRRLIRGRQATRDLFLRIHRERERELARLLERHAASHFSHRSRIQTLLRFKLLQRKVTVRDHLNPTSAAFELDQLQQRTSISLLRERFIPRGEQDSCCLPVFNGSSSSLLMRHPVSSIESEHSILAEKLSNENVHDLETATRDKGLAIATRDHDLKIATRKKQGTLLIPHSLPSTSEDLQGASQSSDIVWQERRLSFQDIDWQATMDTATSSHGGWEGNAITEQGSDTQQHIEVGRTDVTWSTNDSRPHRTRGDHNGTTYQEDEACQSLVVRHKRRLSIQDIDWQGTMNTATPFHSNWEGDDAVTVEPDPDTRQHVEVGHTDGTSSTNDSHSQRIRDGHSEAMDQNWLESISDNEEGDDAMTVEPDLDAQQHVVGQTDGNWSTDNSHFQRIMDGLGEAVYQDWLESISDNEEGDVVTVEPNSDSQQHVGVGHSDETWLIDDSHPQRARGSHSEAMYQDWLEIISDNEEIRELLERRSVSNTLASDFRERMDQLILCHFERQENQLIMDDSIAGDEQNLRQPHDYEGHSANQVASTSAQLPLPSRFSPHQGSRQRDSPFMRQEEQNPPRLHDGEASNVNQIASTSIQLPLPFQSLHHQRGLQQNSPQLYDDGASNVNQVASTSIQLPLPSQFLVDQGCLQQNSSFMYHSSHPSPEIELIYDLRRDMAQMHQEMCELRRSIESCINMQVQLHHSIKQEVSATACHSDKPFVSAGGSSERSSNSSMWVSMRKGTCCICYEMQVDSLLYRCGHMCTCFKCAYELQWSSGICPICREPIVDVVRAYSDA